MSLGALLKAADRARRDVQRGRLPGSNIGLLVTVNRLQEAAPELLASYVRDDFSLGRISARVQAANADQLAADAPEIRRAVAEMTQELEEKNLELQLEPTGFVILMDDMRTYLIQSQVRSVIAAFAMINFVLLIVFFAPSLIEIPRGPLLATTKRVGAALFRSGVLTLFSMIPNVGPIILGVALMAALNIQLDPGTIMIATVALGLVVDDTCHFVVRLRAFVAAGMSLPDAVAETMNQTGRPIILTSVILSLGFATLLLGSFTPTLCFGLVSAFVLLAALAADLLVLPAALLVLRPRV
jgi:predicted RND superfamily exporter protein